MKKLFLLSCIATVASMSLSLTAYADSDATKINGIWYVLDHPHQTAAVVKGPEDNSYSGRLIIPSQVPVYDANYNERQYTVNLIADSAFVNCSSLKGITIPATVERLGLHLLYNTYSVTELKIEDGDTPIQFTYRQGNSGEEISFQEMAYSCTYLYLGRNVETKTELEYASPVFHTWSAVENVVFGEKVTQIQDGFCPYARSLSSIQINTPAVLTAGQGMFMFLDSDNPKPDAKAITLYVPEGMSIAYGNNDFWGRFTIQEMDNSQRYGIKYVKSTFDFYKDGLYYQLQEDEYNHRHMAVVIPQVWYLNPDGTYVSEWSSEFPYLHTSVVIPDSITFWKTGEGDFAQYSATAKSGWDKYTLAVEYIGDYCFRGAKNLKSLTIPSTVIYIGTEAFEYAENLKTLAIPESVVKVGWLAFARAGFSEITIPASSSKWTDNNAAFQDNASLTKATFAKGTTAIQDRIFFGCTALRTIIIPDEVKYIGAGAFAACEALTELKLPASLEEVTDRLFRGCPIRALEIPAGVRKVSPASLLGTNISQLSVNSANTMFDSRNNCNAIIRTADNTLIAAANGAFIPATVDSIAEEAFSELPGIRSITLPANLKRIASNAFMNMDNLAIITSYIANPAGVLQADAFNSWSDDNPLKNATLYVPAGTLAAYKADTEWKKFQHIVEMKEEQKPATIDDLQPIDDEGSADISVITPETDITNAVVDQVYITCDTASGDRYDATEKAIVLNSVVDEVMMENVLNNPDNSDVVRNNFSGIIVELPSGTGKIKLTIKTSGDHAVAVYISGEAAALPYTQAVKGEIEVPYNLLQSALVYIYGMITSPAAAPSKHIPAHLAAKATSSVKKSSSAGSVSIYNVGWKVETNTTALDEIQSEETRSTKVLRNGQLLIMREGKTYNATGAELR